MVAVGRIGVGVVVGKTVVAVSVGGNDVWVGEGTNVAVADGGVGLGSGGNTGR